MKAISFLSTLFFVANMYACELDKKSEYISLSGPVSFLLNELGLLKDKNLLGISVFSPIDKSKFKNKIYGGGLFLSDKEKSDFDKKTVFYDDGQELKKYFKRTSSKKIIKISTRQLDAFSAHEVVLSKLAPYLANCDNELKKINAKVKKVQEKLKFFKIKNKDKTYLFYLGEVLENKVPNLLMVNDGIAKTLVDSKIIRGYPSKLTYVSWSQKIVNSLKNVIHIGISESDRFELIKVLKGRFNLKAPGALTPGLSQIYFLEQILDLRFL